MIVIKNKVSFILCNKINNSEVSETYILQLIDEVEFFIKEYCNITTMPQGLLYTWADMAYDVYIRNSERQELLNKLGATSNSDVDIADDEQAVKSFSVDGISMTFVTGEETTAQYLKNYQTKKDVYKNTNDLFSNYTYILNKYRKLAW